MRRKEFLGSWQSRVSASAKKAVLFLSLFLISEVSIGRVPSVSIHDLHLQVHSRGRRGGYIQAKNLVCQCIITVSSYMIPNLCQEKKTS